MRKRIYICVFVAMFLGLFLLQAFAAGIDRENNYAYVVRTPMTMFNFSSVVGDQQFPVVDVTTAVQYISNGQIGFKLYSAGWEEDNTNSPNIMLLNITPEADITGVGVPINHFSPNDFSQGWKPTLWDGRVWSLDGANQRLTISYNPQGNDYETNANNRFWYKCYSSASATDLSFENILITSVTLNYEPPQWNSAGDVIISPDYSINGNDPAYFDAMCDSGSYTLTFNCTSGNGMKFPVYLKWVAFAGEFPYNMSSFLTQNVSPDVNNGSAYDYGYSVGFQDGKNDMQVAVENAYSNGFNAGLASSDGMEGTLTSAILALGEVPFNMMFQVLDFEILGMNLSALVGMAITGAALVYVIKVLMI